ncbi:MAG TPA: TonB-dependent receptor [Steroidobacteraceae bacterium]|nr:TonB-dependent receptor [Steroidobacteraceae bacterium]
MNLLSLRVVLLCVFCYCSAATCANAATPSPLEEVVVVAPYGTAVDPALVPANVQRAIAEELQRSQSFDLTDFLNRQFSSVSVNHAQNNPLQPDFNFRGFTASPLLGLPQGLAVYQNGVRINDPFGDTVNWDLIATSAIDNVQLLAGAQPVFGLNTLGGALSLRMKNGFTYQGTQAELYDGSFGRLAASAQAGGNDGRWGFYGDADFFEEDGWRDFSKSRALRLYGAAGLHESDWSVDLSAAYANTELRGNGAAPVELLAIDRAAVFTHPDITENEHTQLILEGSRSISDALRISGNVFYRRLATDTFNGDGTVFEECALGDEEFLCAQEEDGIQPVLDFAGQPIPAEMDSSELNAINNVGRREQQSYGGSVQIGLQSRLFGADNDFTLGFAYSNGETTFDSALEVASLLENRATTRTGVFAQEFATAVDSEVTSASVYVLDTLNLSESVAMTVSGRYDDTRIELLDRSGASPELNGSHGFRRFNPAIGVTWRVGAAMTLYASYGESARAPSAVELACASEDAPCNLPNAFLADPPLDQVVAKSAEIGLRSESNEGVRWHVGGFYTVNRDDILFQTTGGPQANVGFFDNVGDTLRTGVELSLSQRAGRLRWFVEYSYIAATFDDDFTVNSPNHPVFEDQPDSPAIAGEEKLLVTSGSSIPGIPRHQGNLGFDFSVNDRFEWGADVVVRSGVRLRADEANLLARTDGYTIANLRAAWRATDTLTLFARVENVFDEDYETFGLLGEPGEVFEEFADPRFLGAGPPRGVWVGARVKW